MTSSITAPAPVAGTDIETTGLDPTRHDVWEVAVKRRDLDGTVTRRLWQIRPVSLFTADPEGLRVSRFHERMVVPDDVDALDMTPTLTGDRPRPMEFTDAVQDIHAVLDGTVMVGSNPHFDASFLHHLFGVGKDPWHYRPVCAVTHAAGVLAGTGQPMPVPWRTHDVSRALGVEPPAKDVAHCAMPDAEWALDLFDAANRLAPSLRGCLVPGCLAQFDAIASMTGLEPVRPTWSGNGWQIIRGSAVHAAGGYVCPAHADQFAAHFPTRVDPQVPGQVEARCTCGKWSTDGLGLVWHGAARGLWEQHLLEEIGALTR